MARKFTYEEVKRFIEVESNSGCDLLSEEYKGAKSKLHIRCDCGKSFDVTFDKFKSRGQQQCKVCSGTDNRIAWDFDSVKKYIEGESECELLSRSYQSTKNPLQLRCVCGNQFTTNLRNFRYQNKRSCDVCTGIQYNYEYVKEQIEEGSDCLILSSEYENSRTIITLLCNCGTKFDTTFGVFSNNKYKCCYDCSSTKRGVESRTTHKEIKTFVEEQSNSGCSLLEHQYEDNQHMLTIKCRCGCRFKTSYNKLLHSNKRQCNGCGGVLLGNYTRKTLDEFLNEVEILVGDEYTFTSTQYTNNHTKMNCLHNKCGHEWQISPSNFLRGRRCPQCNRPNYNRDTESFKKEVEGLLLGEYKVLGDYKSSDSKVRIRHTLCNHVYLVTPSKLLSGSRCPQCAESRGEQQIRQHLENKYVSFQREFSFKDLIGVGGGLLRFDFAILDIQSNLSILIEYDGEFHFEKQYENDNFELLQNHDNRKNEYCKDNNIPLVRIPYWQFDKIEVILDKWLNTYNLI